MQYFSPSVLFCVVTILNLINACVATTNTAIETNSNIVNAINSIDPGYKLTPSDVEINDIYSSSLHELDGAKAGTFSSSSESYWNYDSANFVVSAQSAIGGAWRTFTSLPLPASWSYSGSPQTITLTESVRDGISSPVSPYTLEITLTATASAQPLKREVLGAFFIKSTVKTFTTSGGTSLTSPSALTTGWTAKALFKDGSSSTVTAAGSYPILDPIGLSISANFSTTAGMTLSFTTSLVDLSSWNMTTVATASKDVLFTAPGGRYIKYKVYPGPFLRTGGTGISSNLLSKLNSSNKLINQSTESYLNSLTGSVNSVLSLMGAIPPPHVKGGLNAIARGKISSSTFNSASYTGGSPGLGLTLINVGTGRLGLVALTSQDIMGVVWSVSDETLIANGTIGTPGSAPSKDFSCDLSTLGSATINTANTVLEFSAKDGDAFWLKCFVVDSTPPSPLDATTNTSVSSSLWKNLLAMQLQNILNSTTTIPSRKLDLIVGA